jgi:hypothetical protein
VVVARTRAFHNPRLTIERFRFATANLDAAFAHHRSAITPAPWSVSRSRKAPDIQQPWSLDECPISALTAPVLNWNETLLK